MRNRVCYNCGYRTIWRKTICPVCNALLKKVNIIENRKLNKMNLDQVVEWIENKIGHPIPDKLNALREEYLIKKRLEQKKRESEEIMAIISGAGAKNKVTCSYCHSTNVSKIGVMNRVGSAELWGLGSDKIGKQFHCNNCGANF